MTSIELLSKDWVVYLVFRSFSHSEKLCMGPDPTRLTHLSRKGVCARDKCMGILFPKGSGPRPGQ